jgi:hypothetical protein
MQYFTLDNLTPLVIVLLIILFFNFAAVLAANKISALINKKHPGEYALGIKLTGLIISMVITLIIVFIIRG